MNSVKQQESERVERLIERLKKNKGINRKFPGGSKVHIDRPLPFICIYRFQKNVRKCVHARLINTQASYILIQQEDEFLAKEFLEKLTKIMRKQFGAFLILEVWDGESGKDEKGDLVKIFCAHKKCKPSIDSLAENLNETAAINDLPFNRIRIYDNRFPERGFPLDEQLLEAAGVQYLGMEVNSFYYENKTKTFYPIQFRVFRKKLSQSLKKFFYDFTRLQTRHDVDHFHVLGKHTESDLVWEIDHKLAEINSSFDFLLLVTPTNHEEEWEKFYKSNYSVEPTFQYRMINVDPELLKRELFNLPIEHIEDPTLAYIFRDKRTEMDRMLNMLVERETSHFKFSSIQVYGLVEKKLKEVAEVILRKFPYSEEGQVAHSPDDYMNAEEFYKLAVDEINYLKEQYPEIKAEVEIRKDIDGLMVSNGDLLIDYHFSTKRELAEGLIQHEVGTHVLTYYNGKAQPLRQLYLGTSGYEDLQEGLAVLAEYFCGALDKDRMRTLAARVIAVDAMINGAGFKEVFSLLKDNYNFSPEVAFSIATRVFRGGGFTKDAVYLKGFVDLLEYLSSGKNLEPLLIGKIRQEYIAFMDELIARKILKPSPLKPRYLSNPGIQKKLKEMKNGISVMDFLENF